MADRELYPSPPLLYKFTEYQTLCRAGFVSLGFVWLRLPADLPACLSAHLL